MIFHSAGCKKNERGFTLIEAAVSLVIIAILFLGVSSIVAAYTNVQRVNEGHSAANRLAQILRDRLTYETVCTDAIQKIPFAGAAALTVDTALPVAIDYASLKIGAPAQGMASLQDGVELPEFGLKIRHLVLMTPPPAVPVAQFANLDSAGAPTTMYKVNLVMQTEAIVQKTSGASVNSAMAPRIVGTLYLGVTNGNIRRCMNSLYEVVRGCADEGQIYAPLGFNTPPNNQLEPAVYHAPDPATGCVAGDAFVGSKGLKGDIGNTGPTGSIGSTGGVGGTGGGGPVGNPGPNGPPVFVPVPNPVPVPVPPGPSFPAPAPFPIKFSDARVKVELGELLGNLPVESSNGINDEQSTLEMLLQLKAQGAQFSKVRDDVESLKLKASKR